MIFNIFGNPNFPNLYKIAIPALLAGSFGLFPKQDPEKTPLFCLRFAIFGAAKNPLLSIFRKNWFSKRLGRTVSGTRSGKNGVILPAFCFVLHGLPPAIFKFSNKFAFSKRLGQTFSETRSGKTIVFLPAFCSF